MTIGSGQFGDVTTGPIVSLADPGINTPSSTCTTCPSDQPTEGSTDLIITEPIVRRDRDLLIGFPDDVTSIAGGSVNDPYRVFTIDSAGYPIAPTDSQTGSKVSIQDASQPTAITPSIMSVLSQEVISGVPLWIIILVIFIILRRAK